MTQAVPFIISVENGGVTVEIPQSSTVLSPEGARAVASALIRAAEKVPEPEKPKIPRKPMPNPSMLSRTNVHDLADTVRPQVGQDAFPRKYRDPDTYVRFSPRVLEYMHSRGIEPMTIDNAVQSPQDTWTTPYTSGDQVFIAIPAEGRYGAVYFDNDRPFVVSVKLASDLYDERREQGSGHVTCKQKGEGLKGISCIDELLESAKKAGLLIVQGGHHPGVTDREGGKIIRMPSTPSDGRALMNSIASIKREFGIDLRRSEQ